MFLLGNEGIARGAIEAGVRVATGYPGTPSSEIIDTLATVADEYAIMVEWSVNEKVAYEIAMAASYCKLRSISVMKHVGVNVALDAVMTSAYIGARGGLALVSCDDPGSWSSQNEQDNRLLAMHAYLPVFEPHNVQEAKDMMRYALDFSEAYGHPVMLRSTTRVSHATGDVLLGEVAVNSIREAEWERRPDLLIYDSAGARRNRRALLKRFERISQDVDGVPFNSLQIGEPGSIAVVASGASYAYVKEALKLLGLQDRASILKLGVTYPLPKRLIAELLSHANRVLIVEELEPFVELNVKALAQEVGFTGEIVGKKLVPTAGELTPEIVVAALSKFSGKGSIISSYAEVFASKAPELPPRPPTLCPGCPHRASFFAIKWSSRRARPEPIFPGDIGCYGLGYLPPFEAVDSIICMGGGLGFANGLSRLVKNPIITSIGDSTFFHAGLPALVNAVHNNLKMVVCVLDNDVTAMTGEQPHPGSGITATGEPATRVKIEDVARGIGVKFVEVVDPSDIEKSKEAVARALAHDGPALVVFRRVCELVRVRQKLLGGEKLTPYTVDIDKCTGCLICIRLFGCPAILRDGKKVAIDPYLCTGCGDCAQVCPFNAFHPVGEAA